MGSPKDSIFYSIARFFYQRAILCCHQNPVANNLQGSKSVANNLDLYRSTCNIAVDPHMVPIVSTVDTLCIEQTSPLWGVYQAGHIWSKCAEVSHISHSPTSKWGWKREMKVYGGQSGQLCRMHPNHIGSY